MLMMKIIKKGICKAVRFFWYLKNWILQPVVHAPCLSNLTDYMGEETCSVFILEVCNVTLNITLFLQRYVSKKKKVQGG